MLKIIQNINIFSEIFKNMLLRVKNYKVKKKLI